jgi:hypothetical protein
LLISPKGTGCAEMVGRTVINRLRTCDVRSSTPPSITNADQESGVCPPTRSQVSLRATSWSSNELLICACPCPAALRGTPNCRAGAAAIIGSGSSLVRTAKSLT